MSEGAYPNPTGSLVCCSACGRDTRNKSAVCSQCNGKGRVSFNEQRGRSSRSSQVLGGCAEFVDFHEDDVDRRHLEDDEQL